MSQAIARAHCRQVVIQRVGILVSDDEVVDVQHRVAQAGAHGGITDVMHVEKAIGVLTAVNAAPCAPNFRKAVRAKSGEQKKPVLAQDARNFGKDLRRVCYPRQQLVRENHVNALICKWQRLRICLCRGHAGKPALFPARRRKHVVRQIDSNDTRATKTSRQQARSGAGRGAEIDDHVRFDGHRFEAREQAVACYRMNEIDSVETGGGAIETALNMRAVQCRIVVSGMHFLLDELSSYGITLSLRIQTIDLWLVARATSDNRPVRWSPVTSRLLAILSQVGRSVEHAVLPAACVFCGARLAIRKVGICADCYAELPWIDNACARCASPVATQLPDGVHCAACQLSPPPFTAAVAPLAYTFPVDAAIKAMKFRRKLFYVPAFAHILATATQQMPADIDGILPVPLHWRRHAVRGFNQASEISKRVQNEAHLPLVRNVIRGRATRYQSGLAAAHRRRNLEAAFLVRGALEVRHVLIVDDVITTGETCRQLAKVLLAAGAEQVSVLAIARAGQEPFSRQGFWPYMGSNA